ncbi:MAG: protein-L-isoaspartate(D-aspartate) O-methyltransferase [Pyrinomonadaceae bacterium]|nr:protein-L-isoaspartate(D-aspartate) O-methyltransferase [Pyrinomonadaceae bacterium]
MYILLILSLLSFSLLCFSSCAPDSLRDFTAEQTQPTQASENEFKKQRRQMVERQLRARGIRDQRVLAAMEKAPRHRFVPPAAARLAYGDHPLPIGQEQTISQPYIVAYMTEAAEISASDKVLEIGTGSGYQAAILGELAKEVYTIEIIPELADRARRTLAEMNYKNVHVKTGNGYLGWPEQAPFDTIIVTAAPDEVPPALVEQLAVNGKLIIPVGTGAQEMTVITKTEKGLIEQKTLAVRFVPMTGKPDN